MIGVALKGLAGRKLRALLTAFAVVIGVSMVSGTFILTDTMQKSFDGLFDAVVVEDRRRHPRQGDRQGLLQRQRRDDPRIAAHRGPGAARGRGRRRRRLPRRRPTPPTSSARTARPSPRESSGGSYDAANARFSPLKLKTGEWPQGDKQVVIDAGTATKEHYRVGDTVKIATGGQTHPYELTGHRLVRRRRLARLREHRGLGRQDRPDAARPRGPLRQRVDRGQARHVGGRARRRRASRSSPRTWRSTTAPRRPRRTPRRSTREWA